MCQQFAILIYSEKILAPWKRREEMTRMYKRIHEGCQVSCRQDFLKMELRDKKGNQMNWPGHDSPYLCTHFVSRNDTLLFLHLLAQIFGLRLRLEASKEKNAGDGYIFVFRKTSEV